MLDFNYEDKVVENIVQEVNWPVRVMVGTIFALTISSPILVVLVLLLL